MPRKRIAKTCDYCHGAMTTTQDQLDAGRGRYCSLTCWGHAKRGQPLPRTQPTRAGRQPGPALVQRVPVADSWWCGKAREDFAVAARQELPRMAVQCKVTWVTELRERAEW